MRSPYYLFNALQTIVCRLIVSDCNTASRFSLYKYTRLSEGLQCRHVDNHLETCYVDPSRPPVHAREQSRSELRCSIEDLRGSSSVYDRDAKACVVLYLRWLYPLLSTILNLSSSSLVFSTVLSSPRLSGCTSFLLLLDESNSYPTSVSPRWARPIVTYTQSTMIMYSTQNTLFMYSTQCTLFMYSTQSTLFMHSIIHWCCRPRWWRANGFQRWEWRSSTAMR